MRSTLSAFVAGLLCCVTIPDRAQAQRLPSAPAAVGAPGTLPGDSAGLVSSCWLATRVFRSLASGAVPFCRGHLRYSPGDLDCYQVGEEVCSVYLPTSREWIEVRRPFSPTVFPCPEGPEPPVCPRFTWQ